MSVPHVERNDAGAAESQIVLERDFSALDLRGTCRAAQLPRQLVALRKPGGAERMSLRQQSAGRICHDPATIGVVAVIDELAGFALAAEAERLVGDELVVG